MKVNNSMNHELDFNPDLDLVSIILPTYSRLAGGYLERSINSVLRQSHQHFELIVVDDGSVDGTEEYLRSLAETDPRIIHLRMSHNVGLPALTTAFGYLRARGDYITWLFDDCEYRDHHLLALKSALDRTGKFAVHGVTALSDGKETRLVGEALDLNRMSLGHNCIGNAAVMIRREVVEQVGWYDPHVILKRSCDWDYWLRISASFSFLSIPDIVVDERGIGLADSLGNSCLTNPEVVLRYVSLSRNDQLKPGEMAGYDPFKTDFNGLFTSEEKDVVEAMIREHFVRTLDIDKMLAMARKDVNKGCFATLWKQIVSKNPQQETSEAQYILFVCTKQIEDRNRRLMELQQTVYEKQRFIDVQQAYIDTQHAYVDGQLTELLKVQEIHMKQTLSLSYQMKMVWRTLVSRIASGIVKRR